MKARKDLELLPFGTFFADVSYYCESGDRLIEEGTALEGGAVIEEIIIDGVDVYDIVKAHFVQEFNRLSIELS